MTQLTKTQKELPRSTCPRCQNNYAGPLVISREDNKTQICLACGVKEAFEAANAISENETFLQALEIVKKAIKERRDGLQKQADSEEEGPIMLEGETSKGYYCQLSVDPKDVAKIMLAYDYPTWETLMEDAPEAMWDALADKFGLASVSMVDI